MCSDFHRAESGTELLARLEGRRSLKEVEPRLFAEEDAPMHGTVLELHGPEGTGKTEMLYHLTARCILPQSEGGLEAEVLFVDTDVHFDMLRLVTILEHRLSRGSEETIKQCLGRLFLVCCASSSQLLLTLYSLEAMFCSHPSLCLLILDSFSAFYWVDRANGGESVHLQESTLKKCSQVLEKLVNEYRLAVFATTQSLMRKTPSASEGPPPGPSHAAEAGADSRPYLCQAWQQLVKHRVFFSKDESQTSNRSGKVHLSEVNMGTFGPHPWSPAEHATETRYVVRLVLKQQVESGSGSPSRFTRKRESADPSTWKSRSRSKQAQIIEKKPEGVPIHSTRLA